MFPGKWPLGEMAIIGERLSGYMGRILKQYWEFGLINGANFVNQERIVKTVLKLVCSKGTRARSALTVADTNSLSWYYCRMIVCITLERKDST